MLEHTSLDLLMAAAETVLEVDWPHRVQGRPAASPSSTSIMLRQLPTPSQTLFNQLLSSSKVISAGTFPE